MSDYIKREDAIKIIKKIHSYADREGSLRELETIPSADVTDQSEIDGIVQTIVALERMGNNERKRGEWLQGNPLVRPICSVCGEPCIGLHGFDYKASDFCPNCGADMRRE